MYFFFFKQKTEYEMRISDWSSDVCSSDLISILGSGGISQRAATAGANIIPAVASAKIQRQLIGDLVSDLAIKCLVLVFDVRRRERDARGIGGECNKRSEEHTSELQSLMRISYAVFCLKKKKKKKTS